MKLRLRSPPGKKTPAPWRPLPRITQRLLAPSEYTASISLELVLLPLLLERVHGIEEPKPAVLQGLHVFVLLLIGLCVLLLEPIDERLEVGLDFLHLRLLLLDLCFALLGAKPRELRDLLLLGLIAEVDVRGAAARPEAVCVFLQGAEIPAALVVLQVAGVPVLDRRVAPDADLVAERLAAGGAVDVGDQNRRGVLELSHELVPVGLHLLA